MISGDIKERFITLLKKWWASLLILPYILYTLHMIYWALGYNIFYSINYDYPFPISFIHFFVDNFLLIVHEAGHTFFSIFGIRFITILGGSLFQIILPLLIVGYCWINQKQIGMQFSLVLLGYSWLDVAAYAADGQARQLPLIGGLSESAHDWFNLLWRMDLLAYDLHFGIILPSLEVSSTSWRCCGPSYLGNTNRWIWILKGYKRAGVQAY